MQRTYEVELSGITPILLHNDNLEWADKMGAYLKVPGNKKKGAAGDDRFPAWRWMGCLYIDNGIVCVPSDNLMSMLRDAGKKCPTGNGKESFKTLTQSGLVVNESSWPIVGPCGHVKHDDIKALLENDVFTEHLDLVSEYGFSLFVKRAKIGQSKHVRVRPRFDQWTAKGTITCLDDRMTKDALTTILQTAGMYVGLCDWRPGSPQSPGSFGRFEVAVK
jgi:hypothetical protein